MIDECPIWQSKGSLAKNLMGTAVEKMETFQIPPVNLIWLEATGCSGNIISLLNSHDPDVVYFLEKMVHLRYNNSLMRAQGDEAYQVFLDTLETEFILVVEGAVATRGDGLYTVIAQYQGRPITAMEAVGMAGAKARDVLAVGTCASFGGPSAARPNPSGSISVPDFLRGKVIRLPGCPGHPDWVVGTLAHLIAFGQPELDEEGRPILFYGVTIHDRCTRRSYFDQGIFAQKLGEPYCMFKLGCRGPITRTDCPIRRWNDTDNWPIGANTPCIGCAREGFPDGMEPFIRY